MGSPPLPSSSSRAALESLLCTKKEEREKDEEGSSRRRYLGRNPLPPSVSLSKSRSPLLSFTSHVAWVGPRMIGQHHCDKTRRHSRRWSGTCANIAHTRSLVPSRWRHAWDERMDGGTAAVSVRRRRRRRTGSIARLGSPPSLPPFALGHRIIIFRETKGNFPVLSRQCSQVSSSTLHMSASSSFTYLGSFVLPAAAAAAQCSSRNRDGGRRGDPADLRGTGRRASATASHDFVALDRRRRGAVRRRWF